MDKWGDGGEYEGIDDDSRFDGVGDQGIVQSMLWEVKEGPPWYVEPFMD